MEKREFNSLFKDLIAHLYDYTVLETHPLTSVMVPPMGYSSSRGEFVRKLILDEIEGFKPEGAESQHAIEWRPYHILHQRYVEGSSLRELSQMLSLSERQLRRDNNRSLQALAGRIWDKLNAEEIVSATAEGPADEQQAFDSNLEVLDLNQVIQGIEEILRKRVAMDEFSLILELDPDPILVMSDRIVIRQILISLMGYFMSLPCDRKIYLRTRNETDARVIIQAPLVDTWCQDEEKDHADLLESAQYWCGQMNGEITINHPPDGQLGTIKLVFRLPVAQQPVILVVDDQRTSQHMFQRFLSRSPYEVIGTTDPSQAISLAQKFKPVLITLDVMMPKVDGWEILQALKTDPGTKEIPIIVCSAWEEPELAQSLGAAGFLKKPIRQRDLLDALAGLNLPIGDKPV